MKKKKVKLNLKKDIVSNLQSQSIVGGTISPCGSEITCQATFPSPLCHPSVVTEETCPTEYQCTS